MAEKCISTSNSANIVDNQHARVKNAINKRNRLVEPKIKFPILIGESSTKINSKNMEELPSSTNKFICIKNSTFFNRTDNVNCNEISDKENNSTNKKLDSSLSIKSSTIVNKNKISETKLVSSNNNEFQDVGNDNNDDSNSADSSEDLNIPIDNVCELSSEANDINSENIGCIQNVTRCNHHDNIIYLETPIIDDNVCLDENHNHNDFEKSSAKPKRLSEEFLSSDDNDDGLIDDLSASSSSRTTTTTSITGIILPKKEKNQDKTGTTLKLSRDILKSQNKLKCNTLQNQNDNIDSFVKKKSCQDYNIDDESTNSSNNNLNELKEESHIVIEREDDEEDACIQDTDDEDIEKDRPHTLSSLCDASSFAGTRDTNENEIVIGVSIGTLSSESTVSYYDNDVQSMDAIERRDFEHEQRLTGGILLRNQSILDKESKLNIEVEVPYQNNIKNKCEEVNLLDNLNKSNPTSTREHVMTPTSSRITASRINKSTAKINLSMTLEVVDKNTETMNENDQIKKNTFKKLQPSTSKSDQVISMSTSSTKQLCLANKNSCKNGISKINFETSNENDWNLRAIQTNSNDSVSSDTSYSTSSNHSLPILCNKKSNSLNSKNLNNIQIKNVVVIEPVAGTSQSSNLNSSITNFKNELNSKIIKDNISEENLPIIIPNKDLLTNEKCEYYTNETICKGNNFKNLENENFDIINKKLNKTTSFKSVRFNRKILKQSLNEKINETNSRNEILPVEILQPANENEALIVENNENIHEEVINHNNYDDGINEDLLSNEQQHENDFVDDETWVDCEEGSDEEVCTCYNNNNNNNTEEDDLPSKDVDLSSYIQMVSLSEEMFFQENAALATDFSNTPQQRKRKLNENISNNPCNIASSETIDNQFNEVGSSRKRMALDFTSTPRSSNVNNYFSSPSSTTPSLTSLVLSNEIRRTPRSIIPTKDNPPPELHDWLSQFQRWSHAERLLAVDRLIEHCEPQQVRHMMKVIEPQFQRDFISLLPRELALQVLSYLDPKDLLRAAQTCRSWRYLCDDNLLWKEKCKTAQITTELKHTKNSLLPIEALPKRGRAGNMPPISSPWKAAYMRQHIIEMNWRTRPIRDPKILKGHDDHVITCLQFCGNRIVSGSDDNTLKVWSAVTGKCLRTLVGHTGGVWSSQMSGNIIISGSTDRTLKVWDMETGQCIHTLLGHTSTVRCMHLHGKKVVSGSRDATLRVWDIEQGSCLHVLVGHLAAVRCVQYDGKLIVSGAYDYMVKIWHPERQECLHTLQGHTNRVYSLQFDGVHVVSGSLDTSIRVWDAETGNPKHTLMGHQSLTSGMELRQNILVSGNADSTVKVWDITSGQCLQTLSGPNKHQSAVTCLQFNSRFVITSSDDGTVKLWDVKTGEFIRNLVALESGGSGGVVWRIRANDTKLICAVGSRNGTEETKLMVLDFDVEGACVKCS